MIICPSADQWKSILSQEFSGPEDHVFSQHVETCVSCQNVLESLIRTSGLSLVRLAQSEMDTPAPISFTDETLYLGRFNGPLPSADSAGPKVGINGPQVPGYEILEELGRGGMGVVFKARHLELNRLVALKLLRDRILADADTLARFRDEARAAARLQHPGIVQIHEIDTLDRQPYLVLEYVPGRNLENHLKGTPQPPRDAAGLMVPLAQAIDAAHREGILHRDLKPANILLSQKTHHHKSQINSANQGPTLKESEAPKSVLGLSEFLPKVTDFGLAKPIDDETRRTETGVVAGTPCYMAPEQAAGQHRLGPAVDIYALGAILYEMLTGKPPFKGVTAYDTIHLVLTEEPVPPRRLQPQVPRDLEMICLKCLQKEPTKRYGSAADLAEDVSRYLEGRPILARSATRMERTVKWVRRYPAAATLLAVASFAALTASGLASWAYGAERAAVSERDEKDRQRLRAEASETLATRRLVQVVAEKQRVEDEKSIHQAVRTFLQNKLLGQGDTQLQTRYLLRIGRAATAVEPDPKLSVLLDRAATQLAPDKIDVNFPKQPLVQAELLMTIGYVYRAIGRVPEAIRYLERSRDIYLAQIGADNIFTLTALHHLASAYTDAGKLADAIPLGEQVSAGYAKLLGADDSSTLHTLNNLAVAYYQMRQPAKAIELFERVHEARARTFGRDNYETLLLLNNLAAAYRSLGNLTRSLAILEEAHAGLVKEIGADHPDTLDTASSLAEIYWQLQRFDKSIPLFEAVVKGWESRAGRRDTETQLAVANLGVNYLDSGRTDAALPFLVEAFATGRKNPKLYWVGRTLLDAYAKAGKSGETIALVQELRPNYQRAFSQPSPKRAGFLDQFGRVLVEVKAYPMAEPFLAECAAYRAKAQPTARATFDTQIMLGEAMVGQKKYAEAELCLLQGYTGMKQLWEANRSKATCERLIESLRLLVQLSEALGKKDDAAKWKRERDLLAAIADEELKERPASNGNEERTQRKADIHSCVPFLFSPRATGIC